MMNSWNGIGRLTKDIDLRYTQSGNAVASFSLAIERNFKNAQGEKETDFINCVAWRKTAEVLQKYAGKGSLIGVRGSIQTRNYENQQGQRVYVTEVQVEEVQLINTGNQNNNQQNHPNNGNQVGGWGGNQADPFPTEPLGVTDSDLPF